MKIVLDFGADCIGGARLEALEIVQRMVCADHRLVGAVKCVSMLQDPEPDNSAGADQLADMEQRKKLLESQIEQLVKQMGEYRMYCQMYAFVGLEKVKESRDAVRRLTIREVLFRDILTKLRGMIKVYPRTVPYTEIDAIVKEFEKSYEMAGAKINGLDA